VGVKKHGTRVPPNKKKKEVDRARHPEIEETYVLRRKHLKNNEGVKKIRVAERTKVYAGTGVGDCRSRLNPWGEGFWWGHSKKKSSARSNKNAPEKSDRRKVRGNQRANWHRLGRGLFQEAGWVKWGGARWAKSRKEEKHKRDLRS